MPDQGPRMHLCCGADRLAWRRGLGARVGALGVQAKLKEMEARLKSKEATMQESDGVAAKVARDRHGNFVFQFDKQRWGATEPRRGSCVS